MRMISMLLDKEMQALWKGMEEKRWDMLQRFL